MDGAIVFSVQKMIKSTKFNENHNFENLVKYMAKGHTVATGGHRWHPLANEWCQKLRNQILVTEKKFGAPPAHGFWVIYDKPLGGTYVPPIPTKG